MADSRDEFIAELYTGIGILVSDSFTQVPFLEFKTRLQNKPIEELRKEVLELRKIIKNKI